MDNNQSSNNTQNTGQNTTNPASGGQGLTNGQSQGQSNPQTAGAQSSAQASANSTQTKPNGTSPTPNASQGVAQALSFWKSHPIVKGESPLAPSFLSRIFSFFAFMPFIPLFFLLALTLVFSLNARDLWYFQEILHASLLASFLQDPSFVLSLNSVPYAEIPPLYFAFLLGLKLLVESLRLAEPSVSQLFFMGAALSSVLFLLSGQIFGRLVARVDGRTLLASGIILLSSGFFVCLGHYAALDMLFASVLVLGLVCLFHGFVRPRSFVVLPLGFVLCALACLIQGLLGLALPLLALFAFAFWRKTPSRLFKLDMLIGLGLTVAILGSWAIGVYFETGSMDYLGSIARQQMGANIFNVSAAQNPWYTYLIRLPLFFLPWTLLLLCVRWHRIFSKGAIDALLVSQKPEGEGLAFLWIILLASLSLFVLLGGRSHLFFLPALPALSIIGGRAMLRFTAWQGTATRYVFGVFFVLVGLALIIFSMMLFGTIEAPAFLALAGWHLDMNSFFFVASMLLVLLGLMLIFGLRSQRPEGVLLLVAIFFAGFGFLMSKFIAPSFDVVFSPKAQGLVTKTYIAAGHKPLTYNVDKGIFDFYSGAFAEQVQKLEQVEALLNQNTPVVLTLPALDFATWVNKPEALEQIHRQWLGNKEYLVFAFPAKPFAEQGEGQEPSVPTKTDQVQPEGQKETTPEGQQEVAPEGQAPEQDLKPEPEHNDLLQNTTQQPSPSNTGLGLPVVPQAKPENPAVPQSVNPETKSETQPENTPEAKSEANPEGNLPEQDAQTQPEPKPNNGENPELTPEQGSPIQNAPAQNEPAQTELRTVLDPIGFA